MPVYGETREDGFRFKGFNGKHEHWLSPEAWEAKAERMRKWRRANYAANITQEREKAAAYMRDHRRAQPELHMLVRARARAKASGLPFTIGLLDVFVPEFCPVFGVPLEIGNDNPDTSPELDRIVNALGYVPGNVIVISRRANRLKSDATLAEMQVLADFYSSLQPE
jgi:hypothetical protein